MTTVRTSNAALCFSRPVAISAPISGARSAARATTRAASSLMLLTEETTVPGVYVAGDVSRDVLLIAVAMAEGAKAAVAINRALLREDGLL